MCPSRGLDSIERRYLSVDTPVVRDVRWRCHVIDDDVQTIVGDDEKAADEISKVVALHVIPDGFTIFALDSR